MGIRPISDKPTQSTKRKTRSQPGDEKHFKDVLSKSESDERIQHLFEDIEVAAGDLIESCDEDALAEYRERIKAFLDEVLSESRQVKVIIRESVYEDPLVIVKIIDQKLDDLATLIIREEIERGDLMKMMDEIKGILIDIYR